MPKEHKGSTNDENLLFWLERTICAMRAASGKFAGGAPRTTTADKNMLANTYTFSDDITGLGMPEPCWNRFNKHIRSIAKQCGLTCEILDRYADPTGVVYVQFTRKVKPCLI